jgi:hypothetical protein
MRSSRWVVLVAVVSLGAGLLALGNANSSGQVAAIKPGLVWEYKTHFGHSGGDPDGLLNSAGQEGWELVAVSDAREQIRYTFKRLKQK